MGRRTTVALPVRFAVGSHSGQSIHGVGIFARVPYPRFKEIGDTGVKRTSKKKHWREGDSPL